MKTIRILIIALIISLPFPSMANVFTDITTNTQNAVREARELLKETHLIKRGDTLYKISVKYKVTIESIMKLNPKITNKDKIYAGDRIIIPFRPVVTNTGIGAGMSLNVK